MLGGLATSTEHPPSHPSPPALQAAGVRLSYDHEGQLTGQAATARAVGTTVAVRDIFRPLPVRRVPLGLGLGWR